MKKDVWRHALLLLTIVPSLAAAQTYESVVGYRRGTHAVLQDSLTVYGLPDRQVRTVLAPGSRVYLHNPVHEAYTIWTEGDGRLGYAVLGDLRTVAADYWGTSRLAFFEQPTPWDEESSKLFEVGEVDREITRHTWQGNAAPSERVLRASSSFVEEGAGLLYTDFMLEDYIARLIADIYSPTNIPRIRPIIWQLPVANAYALGDGTIVITTGLLASTRTKEELMGVLAHEVAHVALSHHALQAAIDEKIQQKAENRAAWAAAAAILIGGLTTYAYADVDPRLAAQLGSNVAQNVFANAIVGLHDAAARASAKYSRELEITADFASTLWLKHAGLNPAGTAVFLSRLGQRRRAIHDSHEPPQERVKILSSPIETKKGSADVAALVQRAEIDTLLSRSDKDHDRAMSFLLSQQAHVDIIINKEYARGLESIDRLIAADAAAAIDYTLRARALRLSGGARGDIHAALDAAESKGAMPLTHLERAVMYVRTGEVDLAKTYLQRFVDKAGGAPELNGATEWARSMMQRL